MTTNPRLLIPSGMKPADVRASRIDAPVRRLSGATMGTGWSVSFAALENITNTDVMAALEETFALVIRQMSGWERDSDLCLFNRAEAGWHDLQPEFFFVLSRALAIAELTGGAFDPALADVVDRLGFGPNSEQRVIPEATGHDGRRWSDVKLDTVNRRAFQPGGVGLDLSSIAKGYAVDLCADRLRTMGVPSFLMEIGGEFVGQGVKPDAQPWWVKLELSDLPTAPDEPETDVALVNLAVATSGDFVRRRDGASHLLDGRTGQTPAGSVCGVAVMHERCMDADGWATALFALGLGDGLAMAEQQGLAAAFAVRTPEGSRTILSPAAGAMTE